MTSLCIKTCYLCLHVMMWSLYWLSSFYVLMKTLPSLIQRSKTLPSFTLSQMWFVALEPIYTADERWKRNVWLELPMGAHSVALDLPLESPGTNRHDPHYAIKREVTEELETEEIVISIQAYIWRDGNSFCGNPTLLGNRKSGGPCLTCLLFTLTQLVHR